MRHWIRSISCWFLLENSMLVVWLVESLFSIPTNCKYCLWRLFVFPILNYLVYFNFVCLWGRIRRYVFGFSGPIEDKWESIGNIFKFMHLLWIYSSCNIMINVWTSLEPSWCFGFIFKRATPILPVSFLPNRNFVSDHIFDMYFIVA